MRSPLSGLLGRAAPNTSNPTADAEFGAPFTTGSLDEVLTAAIALEETAVATHLTLLDQLEGTDGAALIASILVTEARHATVLSALSGNDDADARVRPRARRRCPDPRRLPGGVTPMVDRTDDFDAPSFIDRRGFLRLGGFTVAATAVLAACGSDEGAGPEEITQAGSAPTGAEAPSGVVTDSTLLRTATSLHYNALDVIDTVLAHGIVSAEMATAAESYKPLLHEQADALAAATAEIGGQPFEEKNPVFDARVDPARRGAARGQPDRRKRYGAIPPRHRVALGGDDAGNGAGAVSSGPALGS